MDEKFALESQLNDIDERFAQLALRREQIKNESQKSVNQMRNQPNKAELQLKYRNVEALHPA